jgi:hypothetical protein
MHLPDYDSGRVYCNILAPELKRCRHWTERFDAEDHASKGDCMPSQGVRDNGDSSIDSIYITCSQSSGRSP